MIDVTRIMSLAKLERFKRARIALLSRDMHITMGPFMIIIGQTKRSYTTATTC